MPTPTRRSTKGRFAMIPLTALQSDAVTSLNHGEFRVLMAYAAAFNGHNNGSLGVTIDQAKALGIGDQTLKKARKVLVEHGLLLLTRQGTRTPPVPNLYALTWMPVHDGRHDVRATKKPSHAYKAWQPKTLSDGCISPTAMGGNHPRELPENVVSMGEKHPR